MKRYCVYTNSDIDALISEYTRKKDSMGRMSSALKPVADRYNLMKPDDRYQFRRLCRSLVKWYGYISQVARMFDADLHREYIFLSYLLGLLPEDKTAMLDLEGKLQLEYYKLQKTFEGALELDQATGVCEPANARSVTRPEEKQPLDEIIEKINEQYRGLFTEADRVMTETIVRTMMADEKAGKLARSSDPRIFMDSILPKLFGDVAIIDEAQKAPEIFDALKMAVDGKPAEPGKFILTGSSQFRLQSNMTDSLAGRAAFLRLLPFSVAELKAADCLPETAYDLIYNGQYPPLYDSDKHFIPEDWYESYIDTYLDLDVRDQINATNLATFRRFIQVCAAHSGEIFSMEKIGREVGVSGPTIKKWLSVLEASFIIHFLEPDSNNLGRSVVKTPKLYFVDTGLLCHLLRLEGKDELILSRQKGAIVETFAVAEFLKHRMNQGKKANLTYYRTSKGEIEVDMIADWRHTFAVEIKSSTDPETGKASKVRKYAAERGTDDIRSAVFYLGDMSMKVAQTQFVSWRDWGDFFG